MKRSEAILKISENLQKHENMFKGYAKGSIDLKCTCDNLATYLMKELEKMGMLPPKTLVEIPEREYTIPNLFGMDKIKKVGGYQIQSNEWDKEDEKT